MTTLSHNSENYFHEEFEAFQRHLQQAVKISEHAIGTFHTGRQNRSLFVYAKLIMHGLTATQICENFLICKEERGPIDHSSLAVIGRSIIDASLMTHYISNPNMTLNEWDLRRHIMFMHDLKNRKRFFTHMNKAAGRKEADERVLEYRIAKNNLEKKITLLADDLGLSNRLKEFTSGQLVYIDGARGAAREANWDVAAFEFWQSYLSNWVHSHPASFYRADQHKIDFTTASDYQLDISAMVMGMISDNLKDTNNRMKTFTGHADRDELGHLE